MRPPFIIGILLGVGLVVVLAWGFFRYRQVFPVPSSEIVELTADKRAALERLLAEEKFVPHDFPPLGYTGAGSADAKSRATEAVDNMIERVLSHPDGPISAATISRLIGEMMSAVRALETEDRDRTADYALEVWYLLGFKGATGRLAHGSAFPRPPGHAEPLPPGWESPTQPRPLGHR